MQKLGLIGGTGPESTLIYYQKLTHGVAKQMGGQFPYMTIESLSVYDVLEYCRQKDWDGLTNYLMKGINNLIKCGCNYVTLTGITPHVVIDQLQKLSSVPVVSIMDAACDYTQTKGYNKVLLLGTEPTMSGSFFKRPFEQRGIQVVVPDPSDLKYIGDAIENELEAGIVKDSTLEQLRKISNQIISQSNVQAVILGCTELPLAFNHIQLPVEKIDVMDVHINRLIQIITEK